MKRSSKESLWAAWGLLVEGAFFGGAVVMRVQQLNRSDEEKKAIVREIQLLSFDGNGPQEGSSGKHTLCGPK